MPARLTDNLERRNVLTRAGVRQATDRKAQLGGALDTCLLELSLVSEAELGEAMGEAYGIPIAALAEIASPPDDGADRVFPEPWARKHLLAPVALRRAEQSLTILSTAPPDLDLLSHLGELLELRIQPLLAPEFRVHQRLGALYGITPPERFGLLILRAGGNAVAGAGSARSRSPSSGLEPRSRLEESLARLKEARTRDEIVKVALAHTLHGLPFAAIFVVHDEKLEGWASAGGTGTESVLGLSVALTEESAFRTARDTARCFVGGLVDNGFHAELFQKMRRAQPREALIVPLRIRNRTIALLYADNGPQGVAEDWAQEVAHFATHIESALEALLLRRKAETLSDAPATRRREERPATPPAPAEVTLTESREGAGGSIAEVSLQEADEHRTPLLSEAAFADLRTAALESMSRHNEASTLHARAPETLTLRTSAQAEAPRGPTAEAQTIRTSAPKLPPFVLSPMDDLGSDAAPTLWTHRPHPANAALPNILVPPPPGITLTAFEPTPVILAGRDLHADLVLPSTRLGGSAAEHGRSSDPTRAVESDPWEQWPQSHGSRFEDSGIGRNDARAPASRPKDGPERDTEPVLPASSNTAMGTPRPANAGPMRAPASGEEPTLIMPALSAPRAQTSGERAVGTEPSEQRKAAIGAPDSNLPEDGERYGSLLDRREPELEPEEGHYEKGVDITGRIVPFTGPTPVLGKAVAHATAPSAGSPRTDAEVERLIERVLSGDAPSRRAACEALSSIGPYVLPKVMDRFPGPLSVDLVAPSLPPFGACGDLLRILEQFGLDAHPHVQRRLDSPIPVARFFATYFYSAVFVPPVVPRLLQRLHDEEPRISVMAARTLLTYRRTPPFSAVLDHLHGRLESGTVAARRHAAHLVGFFRDAASVPLLIGIFDRKEKALFDSAENALADITKQRLGPSARKWRSWWEKHGRRPRIAWLIDGLSSKDSVMRRSSAEELRLLAGIDLGYDEEAPRKDRDEARNRWIKWWSEQERARAGGGG